MFTLYTSEYDGINRRLADLPEVMPTSKSDYPSVCSHRLFIGPELETDAGESLSFPC